MHVESLDTPCQIRTSVKTNLVSLASPCASRSLGLRRVACAHGRTRQGACLQSVHVFLDQKDALAMLHVRSSLTNDRLQYVDAELDNHDRGSEGQNAVRWRASSAICCRRPGDIPVSPLMMPSSAHSLISRLMVAAQDAPSL
jgi:hypothetical protein